MLLIGITCDYETYTDRRGAPAARYVSPEPYVEAVRAAGGDPVLLPYWEASSVPELLERLDGLVISGGDFDVPPQWYGESPGPLLGHQKLQRSAFERVLVETALARDVPLLGVCGGMQLLNVICGGSLYQDLSLRPATQVHQQPHDKRQPQHQVAWRPDARLGTLFGGGETAVNSTHHQVIREVGAGLRIAATAPDGVVEAIEHTTLRYAAGVQWHPEALGEPQLAPYLGLVRAAAQKPSK